MPDEIEEHPSYGPPYSHENIQSAMGKSPSPIYSSPPDQGDSGQDEPLSLSMKEMMTTNKKTLSKSGSESLSSEPDSGIDCTMPPRPPAPPRSLPSPPPVFPSPDTRPNMSDYHDSSLNLPFTENDLALATEPGSRFDPSERCFSPQELKPQPIIRKRGKVSKSFFNTIVRDTFLFYLLFACVIKHFAVRSIRQERNCFKEHLYRKMKFIVF